MKLQKENAMLMNRLQFQIKMVQTVDKKEMENGRVNKVFLLEMVMDI